MPEHIKHFEEHLMNRIDRLFNEKQNNILSVYFTAGYPSLDSTPGIIKALADSGADMVEIGMPFSDPIADGPVIQRSNDAALKNGMNLKLLFSQLSDLRNEIRIPVLLMGYLNPVLQYGLERFCNSCNEAGIDGVILPDLPPSVYTDEYITFFEQNNLYNILLISPQSDNDRIHTLDKISRGFIYMVSSSSVTGVKGNFSEEQILYFKKLKSLKLTNPGLIGFGISNSTAFRNACKYASGGIIGSAFVKMLGDEGASRDSIKKFVDFILGA
jgi:tryptophan synthase alpha chain